MTGTRHRRGDRVLVTAHTGRAEDNTPLAGHTGSVVDIDTDDTHWVQLKGEEGRTPLDPDEITSIGGPA